MAEQNPQDVVKQEQSVDDPSSADVSAAQTIDSAARAAPELSAKFHVDTISISSDPNTAQQIQYHDHPITLVKETVLSEGPEAAVSPGRHYSRVLLIYIDHFHRE